MEVLHTSAIDAPSSTPEQLEAATVSAPEPLGSLAVATRRRNSPSGLLSSGFQIEVAARKRALVVSAVALEVKLDKSFVHDEPRGLINVYAQHSRNQAAGSSGRLLDPALRQAHVAALS